MNRIADGTDESYERMFELNDHVTRPGLIVSDDFVQEVDRPGGDAVGGELLHPIVGVPSRHDLLEHRDQLISVGVADGVAGELRISGERGVDTEHAAELLPDAVRPDRHDDGLVAAPNGLVGSHTG